MNGTFHQNGFESFSDFARVSRDIFESEGYDQPHSTAHFDLSVFQRVLLWDPPYQQSWLISEGVRSPYLCIDYLEEIAQSDRKRASAIANEVLNSPYPGIPHDFRAEVAKLVIKMELPLNASVFADSILEFRPAARRSPKAHATAMTDGIDHLFSIPESLNDRLQLLEVASIQRAKESRYLITSRLLQKQSLLTEEITTHIEAVEKVFRENRKEQYRSKRAVDFIRADVQNELVQPSDYWLVWDEISGDHTLAELLRIVLLSNDLQLPEQTSRPKVVEFYRSVLRISGRSIIGLRAGVFHVEHGKLNAPSVCYFGRDSALGKGCVVDGVGGVCIGSGAFLGGGFMPILIHTHKHIRKSTESAIKERKTILPVIFCAKPGARLPMSATGLYEAADFLNTESPHPGLVSFDIEKGVL